MEEEFPSIFKSMQLFDILAGNNLRVELNYPHLDFYFLNYNLTFILIKP